MKRTTEKMTLRTIADAELNRVAGGADKAAAALFKIESDAAHNGRHDIAAFLDGYFKGAGWRTR